MKRPRNPKLKTTEKIHIICEGVTEKHYIEQLIKEFNLMTDNITIESLGGGGYTSIKNNIEKNRRLYNIVIIVCDLDRATQKKNEKLNLKALINLIENENLKNNIFLNCPEIEVWIAANIGVSSADLQQLGYEKGNTVCRFLRTQRGSYERACEHFAAVNLYYEKRSFKKGIYKEEAMSIPHSNLVYFVDYMKMLVKI